MPQIRGFFLKLNKTTSEIKSSLLVEYMRMAALTEQNAQCYALSCKILEESYQLTNDKY